MLIFFNSCETSELIQHNTNIYCNHVILVETKCYQTEKLKSLYSGVPVYYHWTTYCSVYYVDNFS